MSVQTKDGQSVSVGQTLWVPVLVLKVKDAPIGEQIAAMPSLDGLFLQTSEVLSLSGQQCYAVPPPPPQSSPPASPAVQPSHR